MRFAIGLNSYNAQCCGNRFQTWGSCAAFQGKSSTTVVFEVEWNRNSEIPPSGSGVSEPALILYIFCGHLKWQWSIPSTLHCLHHIWWWLPRTVRLRNRGCVFVPSSFALRSGCSLLPKLTQLLSFLFEESSATWYLSFSLLWQSFPLERIVFAF